MDNNEEFSYGEYNNDNQTTNDEVVNNNSNGKKVLKIVIIAIILIGIVTAAFFLIRGCDSFNNDPDQILTFDIEEAELKVGETKQINAKLNVEGGVIIWQTSNEEVATVENGLITAVGEGSATIDGIYIDSEGNSHKEQCIVEVKPKNGSNPGTETPGGNDNPGNTDTPGGNDNPGATDNEKPVITYKTSSESWTNKDVTITVNATANSGIKSLQYTTNCTKNCKYTNITSNTIKITNSGTTTVTILATAKNGNTATKEVKVQIDRTAPAITLNITTPNIYNNTGNVQVCATCQDIESGCSQNSLCKTYTQSQSNQTLQITDKVGNIGKSYQYNVIIDKVKPTCSLSVAKDGTLTATYGDNGGSNILYYGFNNTYSGTNSTTQKAVEGTYYYYVKDNATNTNSCSIKVVEQCKSWVCRSGYEKISALNTPAKCYKYTSEPDWGEWQCTNTNIVTSESTNTCTSASDSATSCVKHIAKGDGYYYRYRCTRTRKASCSSGTYYNGACYSSTSTVCSERYFASE